ncbi:hypothetical protein C4J81_00185 [Deltaproteobacteria bacterium Smac51]|nr:hypothetical protein C4J81_00185 [Deltaproteobacteria bacterium Smac51]
MRPIVTFSRHYRLADKIVDDLLQPLPEGFEGSVGLLSCAADAPYREIVAKLADRAEFPVVGGTTLAMPFTPRDEDVSATLAVLPAGMRASVAISDPLTPAEGQAQMRKLHEDCLAGLEGEAVLLLAFMPMLCSPEADSYLPELFRAAGETPVFGGIVSDYLDSDDAAVFAGGQCHRDRFALVGLAGDFKPLFSAACELTVLSESKPVVTEARGNIVQQVDNIDFGTYLRRVGIECGQGDLTFDWPISVLVEGRASEIDGVPEVRMLTGLTDGGQSGVFSNIIRPGARISMGMLNRSNILNSAQKCLDDISAKIEEERAGGLDYSLLFSVICVGRYFVTVGADNEEGRIISQKLPPGLKLFGFYGYNEIGPTLDREGKIFNRSHGESIIVCAI